MSLITLRLLLISISLFFPETFCYRQLVSDLTEIRQSSTYENNVASRAIDGGSGFSMSSGSCSHTGVGQSEAWLRIDLKKVYSINTIEILYRNDRGSDLVNTQRLHGYSLQYYDNEWKECYRDSTPDNVPIPMQSTVPCRQHTQYIRIYTYTPSPNDQYVFLEICEVKILGCDVHQYGKNCTHCSRGCNKCDIVNGCVKCKPRFSGENCESCTAKWYNEDCFQKCSDNCPNDETCNEVKGNCPGRCLPGYRGAICEQKCSGGMYGFKCMNTCDTCVNMSCDHITGSCDHGCTEGWTGDLCVEECSNGTYGFQCKNTCDTCVNMSCDHVNGSCDVGCIDGWTGEMCGKELGKFINFQFALKVITVTTVLDNARIVKTRLAITCQGRARDYVKKVGEETSVRKLLKPLQ
ncbi:protein eyes shut homolog isoform X2 [Saccostrea cucullata]|uniref:protein eyes shut homolog isoform X2 n=1 Tax=Saccostrea cuccullata TaxID=36930 RepID=UPI002ED0CED5